MPADNSYVGWAPIPPPDYTPPEGYAPAGYYSGMPQDNLLTSPFWIFAQAASFLLGFGQPYGPTYSYLYQPCLVPPAYVPVFFGQTVFCSGYYAPSYYPAGYFGRGFVGAYSYGPPVNYITRVTNINTTVYNRTVNYNTTNLTRFHNVMAPPGVLSGNPAIRHIQPQALTEGRALPPAQRLTNVNLARANLNKPNIMAAPGNVRPLTARIPKAPPGAAQAVRTGIPGAGLPARSMIKLNPAQQAAIAKVPAAQQIHPVAPPLRPTVSGKPAAPAGAFKPEARPGYTPPAQPGYRGPEQPGYKPPTQPGYKPPEQPGYKPPAQPGYKGPEQPGYKGPAQPAYKPPEQPGYKPPAQPGYKAPEQPGYKPPAQPAYKAPERPSYTPPAKPAYKAPERPSYTPPPRPSYTPPPRPSYTPPPRPSYTPRPAPAPAASTGTGGAAGTAATTGARAATSARAETGTRAEGGTPRGTTALGAADGSLGNLLQPQASSYFGRRPGIFSPSPDLWTSSQRDRFTSRKILRHPPRAITQHLCLPLIPGRAESPNLFAPFRANESC